MQTQLFQLALKGEQRLALLGVKKRLQGRLVAVPLPGVRVF